MELDDELCLCFHVTKRKVINYIRVEKPARFGQVERLHGRWHWLRLVPDLRDPRGPSTRSFQARR